MVSAVNELDCERIWMRAQSREWKTLAVVPAAESDTPAAFDFAHLLMETGLQHGDRITVADLRAVRLLNAPAILQVVASCVDSGARVIFGTRSIAENVASIRFAKAADCAILCVSLGSTTVASAREAIDQIGKERFLGTVILRPRAEMTNEWRQPRAPQRSEHP